MTEILRLFFGAEEISYTDISLEKSKDYVIDAAKIDIEPGIENLKIGSKLNVTKEDGITKVMKLEIQEIDNEGIWKLHCLGNGFELNNIKIEKVYPAGTTPEQIVQDVIDNFSQDLSFESDWVSGFSYTKRYIADGYAMDIIKEQMDLLDAQLRVEPNDTVYFERTGIIDNGKVLTSGTNFQITKWVEDKESLFNEVKVIGGFENFFTAQSFTGNGTQTEYELEADPTATVKILFDDVEQSADIYEVRNKEKLIVFNDAPANGINIDIQYSYNRPIVVFNDDEDSKSLYGKVFKKVEAPWLESFFEARQYSRNLLDVYSQPLIDAEGEIPFLSYDVQVGEKLRVIDVFRGKNVRLVINKIIYKNDKVELELGTKADVFRDWQREVMDRIKNIEKRAETSEEITFVKLLRHKAKVKLNYSLTGQWNSPVDSFILNHKTLGRLRTGFDMEADCSDNMINAIWQGTGVTDGDQFNIDGFRLSCGVFNGTDRYIDVDNLSGIRSISFFIDTSEENTALIQLSSTKNIKIVNNEIVTSNLNNVDIITEEIDGWLFVYIDFNIDDFDDITIGKINADYYNGKMDELRFYTIKLTEEKINKLKQNIQVYDDLACYLSFDNPKLGDRQTAKQNLPVGV